MLKFILNIWRRNNKILPECSSSIAENGENHLSYRTWYELSQQIASIDAACKQQGPSGTCYIDFQPDDYKDENYYCQMRKLLEPYAETALYQVQIQEKEPNWKGSTQWVASTCFWLTQAQAYCGLLHKPDNEKKGRQVTVQTVTLATLLTSDESTKNLICGIESFHFIYPPNALPNEPSWLWHFHGGKQYPLIVKNNKVMFPQHWSDDKSHRSPLRWQNDHLMIINGQGLRGLVNPQGEFVLPCRYAYLGKIGNMSKDEICLEAVVEVDSTTCDLINLKQERINPAGVKIVPESLQSSIVKVCHEEAEQQLLYGYMDTTGNLLGEIRWKMCGRHYIKYALVQCPKTDLYGFVDQQGNVTIEPQFIDVTPFNYGFTIVVVDHSGKKGVVDETGQMVIAPRWHNIDYFDREYFCATDENGASGLIDVEGNLVVPPRHTEVDVYEKDGPRYYRESRSQLRQALYEQMHHQLQQIRAKAVESLAPFIGVFRQDADERDLTVARLWRQEVELLDDYSGIVAGTTGQISYYYPVSANCFDWKLEVPVTGLYDDNSERTVGVPWQKLRVVG